MTSTRHMRGSAAHAAGKEAESHACALIAQHGFSIMARRCRTPLGEIDVVAASPTTLIFVEVKQRRSLTEAAFALAPAQQRRVLQAADFLIHTRPEWHREAMRIDLIMRDEQGKLEWRKDVLRAF
ncbi:YraN family protein [Asaia krungthepensis]|uniref:UPF0102 protein AA0535_1634 n=1 Tax=Asaia krungthepensis NRIC 0535 TaxID=1307925 RepID=A0ABQ0Q2X3_9PROT|nr:YraN family protein [Asaia krungthepensis]GBQ88816.1 hypothetical protein AA0535_1634 [Asaia krungthepensis NRIC 0535]